MTQGAVRQVLTLLGGAGLAQAVALGASPLLSRLYTPADFGLFALFFSVVTLTATAATGRFEAAVILPAADADGWQLVWLALALTLPVVGLCGLAVAWLGGPWLAAWPGAADAAAGRWFLPPAVLLTAMLGALTAWANRRQAYAALARNRVAQSGVSAGGSIALGVAGVGVLGLLLGSVLGLVTGVAMLVRSGRADAPGAGPDRQAMRRLARQYRDFPRINLPHALLDAAQASLVLALLGAAYGSAALGAYAFALRVARTPLALVGSSVGQVFQQRAARLANERGDLAALARRTTRRLAAIGLPFAGLMVFAPPLFAWAFGAEWREAGECARLLAPWMLLSFMTSPLSQLPLIVGRQRRAFAYGVAYQLAMVLPLGLAWTWQWSLLQVLGTQSALASAVLLAYGAWLHRLARGAR